MPLIYLKHPVHGRKIATLDLEAEYDEQNGWERYTPGQELSDNAPEPTVNVLASRGRRRREFANEHYSG